MALEDQLWRVTLAELQAGRRVVMCTVFGTHGSTPRELGARMVVGEQGLLAGTVGGGCGEAEVAVAARKVLAGALPSACVDVDLSGDFEQTEVQACGGTMDVAVESYGPGQLDLARRLAEAEATRAPLGVATRVQGRAVESVLAGGGAVWPAAVADAAASGETRLIKDGDARWLVQTVGTREEVVIVGSGHVAQPLARIAALLAYRVVVIDDRPAFANRERFPEASALHVGSHAEKLALVAPGSRSSVVIITRGHQHDEASLREALRHGPAYVGMIGSKRRAIGTIQRLAEAGFAPELLARVHTPIGLDIGAQSPEEIALAVMAEIVCHRRGGSGRPLAELRPATKSGEAYRASK